MKLLLFGGTFDPPHLGHMALLKNAIRVVEPGRVLVIPAAWPPHKQASATPAAVRMEMCRCFLPLFPGLLVSDMETARAGPSYTVDTVRRLREEYPGEELYLTVGGDMLAGFTAWRRWEEILRMATLVAQSRGEAGDAVRRAALKLERLGGRVLLTEGAALPLSSSEIREGIKAGRDMLRFVPPPADGIIREKKLYGFAG